MQNLRAYKLPELISYKYENISGRSVRKTESIHINNEK